MSRVRTALLFRGSYAYLLLFVMLLAASATFAQTPQNRYLAYDTYADTNLTAGEIILATNASGQVCAEDYYYLLLINPDGTLAYYKSISSLSAIKDRGALLGITIDSSGDCYLAGQGSIAPTPGAYQTNKSLGLYVVKFNPQGNTVFATYAGGSGDDTPSGIALDPSGNVWLTGTTSSNDFPVTSNAIQSTFGGGSSDAFITELNPTGTKLLYGTYLGGSAAENQDEEPPKGGIAVDSSGNVYVSGTTFSSNFPVLNALQPTLPPSGEDAFVTKISNTGTLLYSTYLPSDGSVGTGMAADSAGNAFVAAYAGAAGFIEKLNPTGSSLVYTYSLPCCGDLITALQADSQGNLSVAASYGALLNPIESAGAFSVVDLDPNGNLIFGTYIGNGGQFSGGTAQLVSMGIDSSDSLYVGYYISSYDSPPLLKPFYGTFEPDQGCCGGIENMIAKVALGTGASFAMPTTVQYPSEAVGNTGEQPILFTLFDTGTTNIDISSITSNLADFVIEQNQCPASLTPATQCNVSVTFFPTEGGIRTGALVIDDDSPGNPHMIQLTGVGLAPGVNIGPTSLTFAVQGINTTSPAQKVSLQNTGPQSLSITQIAISGTNATDFAESNNCGVSLASGDSCTISVTFTPTALGSRTATLTITDGVGVQTVALAGTGTTSLGLGIPAGGSGSASVAPGATAKYTLSIGGAQLSGTATLTCTGVPAGATCTVPGSANISATTPTQFTVSVTTTAPTSAAFEHHSLSLPWFWATALFGIVWLPFTQRSRHTARKIAAISSLLLVVFLVSCGGGTGGSSGGGGTGGTPAGTYNLTVTATMGSTNESQTLTLTVQ
jgi:hypothetical protein